MKPIDKNKITVARKTRALDHSPEHDKVAAAYIARVAVHGESEDVMDYSVWSQHTLAAASLGGMNPGAFSQAMASDVDNVARLAASDAEVKQADASNIVAELTQQRDESAASIMSLKATIAELQASIDDLESNIATADARIEDIDAKRRAVVDALESGDRGNVVGMALSNVLSDSHPYI
jgi:septal ring factor EnvC (AmiA/AmiB activator)